MRKTRDQTGTTEKRRKPMGTPMTRRDFIRVGGGMTLGALALGGVACVTDRDGGRDDAADPSPAGSPTRGGLLLLGESEALPRQALDPLYHVTSLEIMVGGLLYNRLVRSDYNWDISPSLAESWETNDDLSEYTFQLREAEFHDGKTLTAADVAYTLGRHLDEENGSSLHERLSQSLSPQGIEVLGDDAIKFTLLRPDSLFLLVLGAYQLGIVPEGTTDFSKGVGTGPFRLKSWQAGRSFEVDRNPSYWREGFPYLDGVRGVGVPEEGPRIQSVTSGDNHFANMLYASVPQVEDSGVAKVLESEPVHMQNIVMDETQAPFDDERVRRAMKLCLDRDRALAVAYLGHGVIAHDVPAPDSDPFVTDALRSQEMDREEAASLLAEARHPNGLEVELTYSSDELMTNSALGFQAGMADSPIEVKLRSYDASTYWDNIWLNDSFYMSEWFRRHPVEVMFNSLAGGAAWNETKLNDDEFDALLAESLRTTGEEHDAAVGRAMELVNERSGLIVPSYRNRVMAAKNELQGVVFDPETVYSLEEAYLE
jgi:peptide/nickel transport system substrate-binding protein